MKARHIKRLRKVVEKFEVFMVVPSISMFGEFPALTEKGTNLHYFKAENPIRAIRKYLRWYFRKKKEHHDFAFGPPFHETSQSWGKFKVVDMKGYASYYR